MQYFSYKELYNVLFELQRIAREYDILLINKERGWPNSTVESVDVKEKFENIIFKTICDLPKYLHGLLSELHINAIEDPYRCDKYINDVLELLSKHLSHAKRIAIRVGGKELTSPEFDPMFDNHNLLFYSDMLGIEKPSYTKICILHWAAIDYLLTLFQGECEYRLPNSFYESLNENQSPLTELSDVDEIQTKSINEKLIFFKETGIYKLLYNLGGQKNEAVARIIAYIIKGQPNTFAPLLTKIEYKKYVITKNGPDLKKAKKNNPYTKSAVMKVNDVLSRFKITPSEKFQSAYKDLVDSIRN